MWRQLTLPTTAQMSSLIRGALSTNAPFQGLIKPHLPKLISSHRNLEILQFSFPLYKEPDFLWTCIRLLQLRSSNRCYTGCISLLFKVHAWFHRLSTGRCGPVFCDTWFSSLQCPCARLRLLWYRDRSVWITMRICSVLWCLMLQLLCICWQRFNCLLEVL